MAPIAAADTPLPQPGSENASDTIADLKVSVRASLCYFQTIREKVLTLINGRSKKSPK